MNKEKEDEKNDKLDWEYFQVRKFYDPFGRELENHTCEYCNTAKTVQLFETEDGIPSPFRNAQRKILMKQVKIGDRVRWACLDCLNDLSV